MIVNKMPCFWDSFPETTVIPKLYWDSYSQEQRIHALCANYAALMEFNMILGEKVNEIIDKVNELESKIPELVKDTIEEDPAIQATIMQAVNEYINSQVLGRTYEELKQNGFLHPGA